MNNNKNKIIASFIIGAVVGSFLTSNITNYQINSQNNNDSQVEIGASQIHYTDGTYTGKSDAYGPDMEVEVTVENGKISNIDILNHNETPGFYERAFEKVPKNIIKNQHTEVDTISGATYTSIGIIKAVENALEEAK